MAGTSAGQSVSSGIARKYSRMDLFCPIETRFSIAAALTREALSAHPCRQDPAPQTLEDFATAWPFAIIDFEITDEERLVHPLENAEHAQGEPQAGILA